MTTFDDLDRLRIVDAPLPASLSQLHDWGELELDDLAATPPKSDGLYVDGVMYSRPRRLRC